MTTIGPVLPAGPVVGFRKLLRCRRCNLAAPARVAPAVARSRRHVRIHHAAGLSGRTVRPRNLETPQVRVDRRLSRRLTGPGRTCG